MSLVRTVSRACACIALVANVAAAQARPAASQAQYKGILEPVSFSEDIDLLHVFFVNTEVGWAAGEHGTIIHTTDGGKTWEAQLGGDPADNADKIRALHFLDEHRGWAVQGRKTLHTRDGSSWEEIGSAPYVVRSLAFITSRVGYIAGSPSEYQREANTIFRTSDGGRSWKPVFTCTAKVSMGGLNRTIPCRMDGIQFVNRSIGYAVAEQDCLGCSGPPLFVKTTDGGQSWQVMTGPGVAEEDKLVGLFFIDENTGFARLGSKKLHMTTDGGATWRGIVASPGQQIHFADPTVGWGADLGYGEFKMSFTTDGGRRWSNREIRLPATSRDYSFPRRDRAYIVGDHGMVFRYRVVPVSTPTGPNVAAAPAMPSFASPLDDQVTQLEKVIGEISSELDAFVPPSSGGVTPAGTPFNADSALAADSVVAWNEPFEAPLPAAPATSYSSKCCGKSFSRLDVAIGLVAQTLPQFIAQYRNLNLLVAAIRMGTVLPGDYRNLKAGLRTFRNAQDKASAKAALNDVLAALKSLKQSTAVAMQETMPAASADEAFVSPGEAAPSAAPSAAQAEPKAKNSGSSKSDAVKKGIGGFLKKKIP
jgi:photosystem II stability/assembly factor-like uncharacterized protein